MRINRTVFCVSMFAATALIGTGVTLHGASASAKSEGDLDSAQFKTCAELDKDFNAQEHYSRVYDPTEGFVTVLAQTGTYVVDVEDEDCLRNNPTAKAIVDDVLAQAKENNLSECRGVGENLSKLDPALLKDPKASYETPRGTVYVAALREYAATLCTPFGIATP